MRDFLGNELCVGDRVVFASSNDRGLRSGQITSFRGEEPYREAIIMSDGKRETEKRSCDVIKEPLYD